MKIKFQYPLYIPGIYQVYTASRNIHGIYMVYTDYIPGPRRGSAAAGESRCNEIIAFGMEVYSRYIPGMCKNLEYVRHVPDIIVCLTYYDTILYGFQMTWPSGVGPCSATRRLWNQNCASGFQGPAAAGVQFKLLLLLPVPSRQWQFKFEKPAAVCQGAAAIMINFLPPTATRTPG